MTNKKKLEIFKRNLNQDELDNLVQVKYDDNRLRIVAPVEVVKDKITVIQTAGYSKSGLNRSQDLKKRREENLRTLELDKVFVVKEIKSK